MKKLLIADDAEFNREILKELFKDQYIILEAVDGVEAIEQIKANANDLAVIFLDLIMPRKTGMDVLEDMQKLDLLDNIPVIMITGEATADSDAAAYGYGVADIIYKPFSRQVIMRLTSNIVELYEHRKEIMKQLDTKIEELEESRRQLAQSNEFLVTALSTVVEFRDLESGEHIQRVREMSNLFLHSWAKLHDDFNYNETSIQQMSMASTLHDIGKIAIPDEVLLKPGRLTKEEFEIMKTHTLRGGEMLLNFKRDDSEFFKYCYDICMYHHERSDGKGYPYGLKGDEIPVWAQVVSVADVFDALTSPRVYKPPFTPQEAIRMIYDGECGNFSEDLMECFKECQPQLIELVIKHHKPEELAAGTIEA